MSKNLRKIKKISSIKERGQVLVLVALALVGIIAIVGLSVDAGIMFLEDARLRRAVDSAALAAALQYRSGVVDLNTQLKAAAREYVVLNGIILDPTDADPVKVHTCTDEPSMCYDPVQGITIPRKLVSVQVNATVHLAFLPVIGINTVKISATATGESASLDLVLVLDTSESMTFEAPAAPSASFPSGLDPALRDPTICNSDAKAAAYIDTADGIPGECHPFEEVKKAAISFVNNLYYPYDRVTVVNFDKTATTRLRFDENCDAVSHPSGCTADEIRTKITDTIKNLRVFDANTYDGNGNLVADNYCPNGQPCRPYCLPADMAFCNNDYYANFKAPTAPGAVYAGGFDCGRYVGDHRYPPPNDAYHYGSTYDPHECTTTDISSGLYTAGVDFGIALRQSSLWVVVILTDGAANMGTFNDPPDFTPACPGGPNGTWDPDRAPNAPFCRDISSLTRHCANATTFATCQANGNGLDGGLFRNGVFDPANYDADDAAHDAADYVGLDQKAVIFSIGFTKQVTQNDYSGERLLKYAAKVGDGAYFYGADSASLFNIFKQIGDKIATRLAR